MCYLPLGTKGDTIILPCRYMRSETKMPRRVCIYTSFMHVPWLPEEAWVLKLKEVVLTSYCRNEIKST
uniref:Uncharacterized protein n=1 Tax=Zea mays TaxID=4577 RepID=A0A804M7W8_MAIZE